MRILHLLCILLLFTASVSAKDYSYKEVYVNASMQKNSDIIVEEKITVVFIGDFSYGYRYFDVSNIRNVENFRVLDEKYNPYKFEESSGDGKRYYNWVINAHDETKTFILGYIITGAVKSDREFDKLYYTAVFRDREKSVDNSVFAIKFPEKIEISDMKIRTNIDSKWIQTDKNTIQFNASNIPPYTPFDIEILFPRGIVEIPFDWKPVAEVLSGIAIIIAFLYVAISNFLMIKREHAAFGKDPEIKEIINLENLKNLKPAIAGTLLDEKSDVKEIIATVIDLAVRGYIHIQEEYERFLVVQKKRIYLINMKKDESGLLEYEKLILTAVFNEGDKIEISSLRNRFYTKIPEITSGIFKEATRQGLFPENPENIKKKYQMRFIKRPVIFGVILFLSSFLFAFLGFVELLFVSIPIILLIVFVTTFFFVAANYMPKKTIFGVMEKKKYTELKDFMEKYPLKEGRLFDEYLPHAIAFGIQAIWLKKLDELQKYEKYTSSWYSGAFNTAAFTSFSHSLKSSMTSSPGGSSGGGGSGGGFGGGGGAGGGGGGFG